jgi:trimeric autotransporter adhesin
MKKILSFLIVILACLSGWSQAPGIFNYQGIARNSVGNVLENKLIALRLSVHDGSAGGPVVYSETRSLITNPFGLFNVQVGSPGTTFQTGSIASVNWGTGSKFIQVEIDPNGGNAFVNIGTAEMASVPFSLFASSSSDLVLPFDKTQAATVPLISLNNSGSGAAIQGVNTGTGRGGYFQVNNAASTADALRAETNGVGASWAFRGISTGTNGAGLFVQSNTSNTANNVQSNQSGLGRAGLFQVTNVSNSTNALEATTVGEGTAISGSRSTTTGTNAAIQGTSGSQSGNANAILGSISSTSPGGFSSALRGINSGTGGLGIGVYGSQDGSGWGVYGTTPNGIAVHGNSANGFGMYGLSNNGMAVYGLSTNGTSGAFEITNNANTSTALLGRTNGAGVSITGSNTGLGSAGLFMLTDNSNTSNAVEMTTPGSGSALRAIRTSTTGTGAGMRGESNSQDANATGALGIITSTSPGGFSSGLRGINNGTGGLGIGVYGSQGGSGWGVYGTTPNGLGVHGNSTNGFGMYGLSTNGTGIYGLSTNANPGIFEITNTGNNFSALEARTSGTGRAVLARRGAGSGVALGQVEAIRGDNTDGPGVAGTSNMGVGIYGTSTATHGVWGVSVTPATAGVLGRNDQTNGFGIWGQSFGGGIGVYGTSQTGHGAQFEISNAASTGDAARANQLGLGRGFYSLINNTSNIVAAVRGETNGGGYGIFGQATGNGNAGFFQISNPASSSSTMSVTNNGIGSGITIQQTNASNGARGIDVLQAGVGPGVFATSAGGNALWGITSSISAAGVIGDNTFGEAVVGRNRGGVGVGAVVGRNDSLGYGVRGFNTKGGIGVLGQTGISGGQGTAGRFENVNSANPNIALIASTNGTGAAFLASNVNAAASDLAIFQKSGANVARVDGTGKVFANGGFQASGADVAEYFEVEGLRNEYETGDILVISQQSDRKVQKSSLPYSTLVVGVYATQPGVSLTERNAEADQLADMVPMGVLGVIPTKVCLEGGVIKRGDLLVTSSIPGVAMKADLKRVEIGQVLGKALQDYDATGIGKIKVLVNVK